MADAPTDPRLPVHVLSGFLGSGKTTLLNRILGEGGGERIACIVNEFGDVPIDGRLVTRAREELVELANGCVCCTVRGDLARSLGDLLALRRRPLRPRTFDRIVIETSGLASPGPVLQTLLIEPALAAELRPAGVYVLVHAGMIASQIVEHPEVREQLAYADRIALNHADRASEDELTAAEALLREHNAFAPIDRTTHAEVDLAEVRALGLGEVHSAAVARQHEEAGERTVHTPGAGTVVLRTERALDIHRLKMWLQFLSTKRSHEIWRLKGILRCVDHPDAVVVQGVYQWLELGPGEERAPEASVLVLIGRDLDRDELVRGFEAVQS